MLTANNNKYYYLIAVGLLSSAIKVYKILNHGVLRIQVIEQQNSPYVYNFLPFNEYGPEFPLIDHVFLAIISEVLNFPNVFVELDIAIFSSNRRVL